MDRAQRIDLKNSVISLQSWTNYLGKIKQIRQKTLILFLLNF